MALELGEAVLFTIIGLVIGIAVLFFVMQARVSRQAQQIYESRKHDLEGQYQQRNQDLEKFVQQRIIEKEEQYKAQSGAEFDKWKAEFLRDHEAEVATAIENARKNSVNSQRSSLKGKINEQIASLFPEFTEKYIAADARFLGSPVDFVVFKNLHTHSSNNGIEKKPVEIVFVEVKTGKSQLNPNERAVRDAISNKYVKYDLLKISLDSKEIAGIMDGEIVTEDNTIVNGSKQFLQICPRCQFGLKCDCDSCPSCPNKFTLESDTPA